MDASPGHALRSLWLPSRLPLVSGEESKGKDKDMGTAANREPELGLSSCDTGCHIYQYIALICIYT